MKHLKLYENFQTEKEVADICSKYGIENWSINSEGLVDVDGDVGLYDKGLYKIPLKFGKVTGKFDCDVNKLTSLDGAPKQIGGGFYCNSNNLISFEGAPDFVGGCFDCHDNKLISFEGASDFVGGYFYCVYNPIYEIWKLFEDYSKIELFNYYDIVRELDRKPAIVLARLNQFLEDIGKKPVEKVKGYINL